MMYHYQWVKLGTQEGKARFGHPFRTSRKIAKIRMWKLFRSEDRLWASKTQRRCNGELNWRAAGRSVRGRRMGWSSKIQGMNGDLFFSLLGVVQTHCRYINGCHKQEEEICDLPWDWTNFLLVSVSGVLAATLNSGRLYCIDWKMITWYCFDDVSYWFDQKWCVPQFIKKTKVKHHDSRGSPAMFSDQPTTWTAGSVN